MTRRALVTCLTLILSGVALMNLTGCEKKQPSTTLPGGTLSGKVMYKDQPVGNAQIEFYDAKGNKQGQCVSATDGTYSVSGLPPGKIAATIKTQTMKGPAIPADQLPKEAPEGVKMDPNNPAKMMKEMMKTGKGKMPPGAAEGLKNLPQAPASQSVTIPAKYADPATSGINLDIVDGPNQKDLVLSD